MKKGRLLILLGCIFLGMLLVALPLMAACAPAAKVEYPTQNIRYIVHSKVGGGFDVFSRALGPYLLKNLPRETNIIYENISGAGGAESYAMVYVAKPDGYTIGLMNVPGASVSPYIMPVKYDLSKFTYLGRGCRSIHGLFVNKKSPYHSLKDLQQAEIVKFAAVGIASTSYLMGIIAAKECGFNMGEVVQYKGGTATITAVVRGDTEALFMDMDSVYSRAKGELRPILTLDTERYALYPDTPSIVELGYPELAGLCNNKIFYGPPDMPAEIAKILGDALWKAVNDPGFIAWGEKADRAVRGQLKADEARELSLGWMQKLEKYKDLYPQK